ncbi:MAG: nucleotidyltransferase domain-containing protein [Deferrisomatales bacterium]|nr:nucleotidyltransferase domain-containing protein [Deferrisomatales bacterium]
MAEVPVGLTLRVRPVRSIVSRYGTVVGTFLFGSHAWGTPTDDSDIDVAAFVEGGETWALNTRAKIIAETQRLLGDDIELHIFPGYMLAHPPAASLARKIVEQGVRIDG